MRTIAVAAAFAALFLSPLAAEAAMSVKLGAPWDGARIPAGQHCPLQGGSGATPPLQVSDMPKGTQTLVLSFNDLDFAPLSQNGGHGQIAVGVKGSKASVPAFPGMSARLPAGAKLLAPARSTGSYASPGYLPPCSNRSNHRYVVDVMAIGAGGKVLETVRVQMGRY